MNERTSKELMGLILKALHKDSALTAYVGELCEQGIVPTMNIKIGFMVRQPEAVVPDSQFDKKFLRSLKIASD